MSARDELAAAVAEHGPFPMPTGDTEAAPMTPEREQQIRAELTTEFVAWLVKKAREYRAKGPQYAKQADVIARLADKVQRGAVRPNNLLSLPPQGGPEDIPALRAEVDRLRARVAELEALAEKVAAFCAQRAEYITSLRNCHPDNGHDYDRWQGHAAARRQLSQSLGLPVGWPAENKQSAPPTPAEDPHDSPLHHTYETSRDLPEVAP